MGNPKIFQHNVLSLKLCFFFILSTTQAFPDVRKRAPKPLNHGVCWKDVQHLSCRTMTSEFLCVLAWIVQLAKQRPESVSYPSSAYGLCPPNSTPVSPLLSASHTQASLAERI